MSALFRREIVLRIGASCAAVAILVPLVSFSGPSPATAQPAAAPPAAPISPGIRRVPKSLGTGRQALPRPTVPPMPAAAGKSVRARPMVIARLAPRGIKLAGPTISRPNIDDRRAPANTRGLVERFRRTLEQATPKTPAQRAGGVTASGSRAGSAVRRTATVNVGVLNKTGINRWWEYEEGTIPGIGRYMVNMHWQNVIVQANDENVPYRGLDMAFRRTYNSFSDHDYAGTDGSVEVGQFGNGWTNTFDAHVAPNSSGGVSVYDIDGARYDYSYDANGALVPPAGMEGVTLVSDDGAEFFWTKKNGTQYAFYAPYYTDTVAAYSGRLYRISARNRNSYIQFTYAWDATAAAPGGDSSSNAYLNRIYATTDSGLQTTVEFGDSYGRRLASSLTRPDGKQVIYQYNADGTLGWVTKPGSTPGSTVTETYTGYRTSFFQVSGPRWYASGGGDGGYVAFALGGYLSAQTTGIYFAGVMNPTPDDNTGTPMQSGPLTNAYVYNFESFSGVADSTTISDRDGHQKVDYIDGLGRVTERHVWTGSQWLYSYQTWDAHNNVVRSIDQRGYVTDFLYDANNNTVALAEPQTATSDGTFRPTQLYDYDYRNNVTAFCDESQTGAVDFASLSPSDTLCSGRPGVPPHVQVTYEYTAAEPHGRLLTYQRPSGYTKTYQYANANQGGNEYGLPTLVTGTQFQQTDGSQRQPAESYAYDGRGNLTAYDKGNGAWQIAYDVMNRPIQHTDPDGVSSYTAYGDNGLEILKESASQHATGQGTTLTYDLNGNLVRETRHNGGVAGTTRKWYDGADRLIEVMQPRQPDYLASKGSDYAFARPDVWSWEWMTRYLYDLTNGGTPVDAAGPGYGNLYRTQEYVLDHSQPSAHWDKMNGTVYDALDRQVRTFDYGADYGKIGAQASRWFVYDTNNQSGLLTQTGKASSTETEYRSYDERGKLRSQFFMDVSGGQYTTSRTYAHDAAGRVHSITASNGYGSLTYAYDADGNVLSKSDGGSSYDDAPSVLSYTYYPDGLRRGLSVGALASGGFNQTDLFTYAYRPDGLLADKHVQIPSNISASFSSGDFTWTYSPAGRFTTRSDPFTGQVIGGLYAAGVRPAQPAPARTMKPSADISNVTERIKRSQAATSSAKMNPQAFRRHAAPEGTLVSVPTPAGAAAPNMASAAVICPLSKTKPPPGAPAPISAIAPCCSGDCPTPDPTVPPGPTPTPGPTATPRPQKTFVPVRATYDGYGQISSYQLPSGGTYNQFAYDAEGVPTSYWGYGDASVAAKHVSNAYNVRGELTAQHFHDGAATTSFNNQWPYFSSKPANGTMLGFREAVDERYFGLFTAWIPRDGKVVQTFQNTTYNTYFGVGCSRAGQVLNFSQDASARDVSTEFWHIASYPPDCSPPAYFHGVLSKSFDFEDHLMQWNLPSGNAYPGPGATLQCMAKANGSGLVPLVFQNPGTINYGWGPEDKLTEIQVVGYGSHALHWDGDELLFVTNGNGTINGLKVGSDAEINPQGTLVVRDRDWAGSQVLSHDASGYSQWLPPNPYRASCTPNSPPGASPTYDSPADPIVTQKALDGYSDGVNVFQGVRTYDPQTTQWSTPDAYAGDVHDPMSQKPFMWNRNDSFRYADPSGYCVEGKNGCMGGVDWNANYNFANGLFELMTWFTPVGEYKIAMTVGQKAAPVAVYYVAKGGAYTLRTANGIVVRSGRTIDLIRREQEHFRTYQNLIFHIEMRSDDKLAQRGAAQILHETYRPILDRVRDISPKNPRLQDMLQRGLDALRNSDSKPPTGIQWELPLTLRP